MDQGPSGTQGSGSQGNGSQGSGSGSQASGVTAKATVTCWDGTSASRLGDCGQPTGPEGLQWVFPSMKNESCTNLAASTGGPGGRVQLWECRDATPDGTPIKIHYSQWTKVPMAVAAVSTPTVTAPPPSTEAPIAGSST